ncbi:amino acid permease/ SLC12A domain-containing protein [Penicillium citrinum]|uniref:Amino acid permease/ SLC12A domain-containing protein n=1 Tax=Penicillium citrinum TaxID=5077 RepID=A0A9W9NN19_PENCI|nr:amino acid permease/ SLC12A domain-containing protein [Penicillium citrinum]KAJ5223006.1 amino acid permease/ SLC12A domain-containing protein [Penicillium citrinum]
MTIDDRKMIDIGMQEKDLIGSDPESDEHQVATVIDNNDQLKRHLGNRQIQLIAIGGSIGTATFVSITAGLTKGGPGSLFLAYTIYSCMMGLVNNCIAEMAVFMPVTGAFIRMAGKWVDESFGFWAGWNFFLYEASLIPFEISALHLVLNVLNAFTVKWYGEAEFWLSTGKVILILIVFLFTFITMVGGNPKHDAYGFRYWKDPGSFAEHITTGSLGRFEGFLGAVWSASFTVVGPEYISMVAGETKLPRRYLKTAFKTTYARFAFFFIGSALCVGIVIPYNDKTLLDILSGSSAGSGTAAASPYVIAMNNLGISVLPHITNALLVTSIFSAGNTYTYYGTRSLYGLSLQGQAPKILRKCTKKGVPIYCLFIVIHFPVSRFPQCVKWFGEGFNVVDEHYHCGSGYDRRTLPYYGCFQPYSAWIGLVWMTMVVCTYGYAVFLPGSWVVGDFFTYYTMVLLAPVLFFGWKLIKRTKFIKAQEADLIWDRPIIDAYEASFVEYAPGFWTEIFQMFGFRRSRKEKRQI